MKEIKGESVISVCSPYWSSCRRLTVKAPGRWERARSYRWCNLRDAPVHVSHSSWWLYCGNSGNILFLGTYTPIQNRKVQWMQFNFKSSHMEKSLFWLGRSDKKSLETWLTIQTEVRTLLDLAILCSEDLNYSGGIWLRTQPSNPRL